MIKDKNVYWRNRCQVIPVYNYLYGSSWHDTMEYNEKTD